MNNQALPVAAIWDDGDLLLQSHAALVSRIAHHMKGRLPERVEVEDLIQAGMIGLLEAARNFREGQGAEFATFAGIRIRGAMLDEVRRNDWTPRSVYRKSRELSGAIKEIEALSGREAQPAEIAEKMGISLQAYHDLLQDLRSARMLSVEDLGYEDASGLEQVPASDEVTRRQELRDEMAAAIATLPQREALLLSLYYEEELNLREIGEVLGVSESRVCQLHSQAVARMRARMKSDN